MWWCVKRKKKKRPLLRGLRGGLVFPAVTEENARNNPLKGTLLATMVKGGGAVAYHATLLCFYLSFTHFYVYCNSVNFQVFHVHYISATSNE